MIIIIMHAMQCILELHSPDDTHFERDNESSSLIVYFNVHASLFKEHTRGVCKNVHHRAGYEPSQYDEVM